MGVRGQGLKLISDNGTQPTSVSFMRDMATLGIEQIYTSYDNTKRAVETEGDDEEDQRGVPLVPRVLPPGGGKTSHPSLDRGGVQRNFSSIRGWHTSALRDLKNSI